MIPINKVRALLLLVGISVLLVGVDLLLRAFGLRGTGLTVFTGMLSGAVVFLLAMEGGRTLRFCAKGIEEGGLANTHAITVQRDLSFGMSFNVSIVDSNRVFAVSVSEGKTHRVFLSRRLFSDFSSDALRGVMAHELGHMKHRHPTKQAVLLGLVAAVKMSFGIPAISSLLILLSYLWMLREWELIADSEGARIAGAGSLVKAFAEYQIVTGEKGDERVISDVFSGHPSFSKRLSHLGKTND